MLQARMRFIAPQKYGFICTYANIFHRIENIFSTIAHCQ